MNYKIGFSPCPNDTFIFDALMHGKIDLDGFQFESVLADVEALNQMAFNEELPITKLSYHAFCALADKYALLNAGSAMGNNCGPLLISKGPLTDNEIANSSVAIPGAWTTANFLLDYAYPQVSNKVPMLFSEIETAMLEGKVDCGVIIHENRFTYQEKGLHLIQDLGAAWENGTGYPIPLGGIAVRRDVDPSHQKKIAELVQASVEFAFAHPDSSKKYVKDHAQEMSEEVQQKHIALYVNDFSKDLGQEGKAAVTFMYEHYLNIHKEVNRVQALFV